ncbi:unnamed protein product [Acanthoscelides obtectus]|uniref:Uncharacterized protein n=1 Tax=Acanthoscelides obtectus TaxID=200917 RepID=A0A9P0PBN6_ACAOB|nr:unnamed protein product [Acanthoscelides obtectus]CAK1685431.1 hypothetical protein AOBTE_LOCUS35392 [Acanthoscelides obtectus]
MPVKIETWEFDDFLIEELFPDEPIMEPVLSDDIWKKFEIDYPELTGIAEMLLQEEQSLINDTKDIEAQQGCLIPGLTPVANPVVISGVVAPEIVTPSVVTPAVVTPALVTPVVVTPAVVIPPNNRGNNTSNPSVQVTSANPPASLPASPASGSPPSSLSEIRNHDCMWAGSCFYGRHGQGGCQGSSEGGCQRPKENGGFLKPGPVMNRCPPQPPLNAFIKKEEPDDEQYYQQAQYQHHQTSRSVLKPAVRAAVKQQQQQQQHMPQTPPMSDDEEGKSKPSKVLSLLTNDPISPTEYSSDTELCEYLQEEIEDEEEEEEEGDEEEQDEEEIRRLEAVNAAAAVKLEEMADRAVRVKAAAEIDHSYHKGKGSDQMMQEYLGLETPSDSVLWYFQTDGIAY